MLMLLLRRKVTSQESAAAAAASLAAPPPPTKQRVFRESVVAEKLVNGQAKVVDEHARPGPGGYART